MSRPLLLVVGVEVAESDLDVGQFGDGLLLDGVDPAPGPVVPVHAQESAVREDRAGLVDERLDQPLRIEVEGAPVLGAGDEQPGRRVHIARVHEDRVGRRGLRHLGEHAFEQLVGAVQALADLCDLCLAHTDLIVRARPVTHWYLDIQKISLA